MKLCDTCIYRNNVEQLKPCIIYRDNCEYYEKEREDMTREEAITELKILREDYWDDDNYGHETKQYDVMILALDEAIKALEQEPNTWSLDDAREDFMHDVYNTLDFLPTNEEANRIIDSFDRVTSNIEQEPKTGHCKDCKHFEYDSVAKVDGIPLIIAHEICNRWGDGCKTKENGYCFLFEPQESEE